MDRNFFVRRSRKLILMSLSARRAWIEIEPSTTRRLTNLVALRKESVDRNFVPFDVIRPAIEVALRKESVDRNIFLLPLVLISLKSLSARRAWIEIPVA